MAGPDGRSPATERAPATPPGHPEGYLKAFANIYSEAAETMEDVVYPTVQRTVWKAPAR